MTRRSGLGKGLSSLIPPADGGGRRSPTATARRWSRSPSPTSCPTRTSRGSTSTRRRSASWPRRSPSSACCSRSSCAGSTERYQLIAGERRWRAARRAGLPTVPAVVRTSDDVSAVEQALVENLHRAGPHPARGGGGVPAADRGLRADPRRRRPARRQEPLGDHQHAAPARAAAGACSTCSPTGSCRPATPGPCSARRTGRCRSAWPARRPARAGRCGRSRSACATGEWRRAAGARAAARRRRPRRSTAPASPRPPGCDRPGLLELEQLLADLLDTRVGVQMGAKRGKVTIEFADLEDLERIYRLHRRRALNVTRWSFVTNPRRPLDTVRPPSSPRLHTGVDKPVDNRCRPWSAGGETGVATPRACSSGGRRQGRRGPGGERRDDRVADHRGGVDDALHRAERAHDGGHPRLAQDRQAHPADLAPAGSARAASKAMAEALGERPPPADSKPAVA